LNPVFVRPAHPKDAETILRFNIEMAKESENLDLSPEIVRRGVEISLHDPERGEYFLAEGNKGVVGQIRATREWSDWNNSFYWWIQNVYVEPSSRRQGIYAALHNHVRDLALHNGACGLLLYVDRENSPAQEVYRKMGMKNSHYLIFEQKKYD